jgi:hypothetical protein
MTLRQYIQVMDALIGIDLTDDMTGTDMLVSYPKQAYKVLLACSDITEAELMAKPVTEVVGMLEIAVQGLYLPKPYEVPFIEVNGKTYKACEPLLMDMGEKRIPYGNIEFGNCIEALTIMDNTTHTHRAMPMVLAYLYEGDGHVTDKANEFLDMDARDAASVFFFFARLGHGYTIHLLNQLREITVPQNIKPQGNELVKIS